MKIEASIVDNPTGTIPLLTGASLIFCDHCGIVAVDTPRFGWKRWTETELHDVEVGEADGLSLGLVSETKTIVRHHCPAAIEYNEWVSYGLVSNVAMESAVTYEDWPDED